MVRVPKMFGSQVFNVDEQETIQSLVEAAVFLFLAVKKSDDTFTARRHARTIAIHVNDVLFGDHENQEETDGDAPSTDASTSAS